MPDFLTSRQLADLLQVRSLQSLERFRTLPGFPKPVEASRKLRRWRASEVKAFLEGSK